MADSRSARPKWIPTYSSRTKADGTFVQSAWSAALFGDRQDEDQKGEGGDGETTTTTTTTGGGAAGANGSSRRRRATSLGRDDFCRIVRSMPFEAPLGGPSVSASAAQEISDAVLDRLWLYLTQKGKVDKLSRASMQRQLQRMATAGGVGDAGGSGSSSGTTTTTGVTWKQFSSALLLLSREEEPPQ
jgi:hypothetical protein